MVRLQLLVYAEQQLGMSFVYNNFLVSKFFLILAILVAKRGMNL